MAGYSAKKLGKAWASSVLFLMAGYLFILSIYLFLTFLYTCQETQQTSVVPLAGFSILL